VTRNKKCHTERQHIGAVGCAETSHGTGNCVIKLVGDMEEFSRNTLTLVTEVAQYPAHVKESSLYTNNLHLFNNRIVVMK
jgi:hypothetical protein